MPLARRYSVTDFFVPMVNEPPEQLETKSSLVYINVSRPSWLQYGAWVAVSFFAKLPFAPSPIKLMQAACLQRQILR
ncbi:uncharacterized protein PHALS_15180 [Plasmopara halstedii]|uniref:Uncharacterized protein n=1 Tax=Plasmopara halstedii TaxID=4781 RepID=A0A0P1B2B8_PLAHL|nr:uncharacterized protein PHALS_15180 [Plasmopara halstedii]CEG48881.1 hypothetical protein PHALS_15180 [Plasmopara halstedii]|eukprot:XP_024585250.1 hypothetical protein PHALS_15180 [Plasmopara halstedii]